MALSILQATKRKANIKRIVLTTCSRATTRVGDLRPHVDQRALRPLVAGRLFVAGITNKQPSGGGGGGGGCHVTKQ